MRTKPRLSDALTSRRAYKEGMLATRALAVLYSMRERDFPPGLVERFIKFMGPYPVGSFVRLGSGDRQQVVRIVRINPTQAAAEPASTTTGGSSS